MTQEEELADRVAAMRAEFDQLNELHARLTSRTIRGVHEPAGDDFMESLAQWRFEHPVAYRWVCGLFASFCLVLMLSAAWVFAGTSFGQAVGFASAKQRTVDAYYAAIWAMKVGDLASVPQMEPQSFRGQIEQVIDDMIVVSYYENNQQKRRLIKVANVSVRDREAFKRWALQYRLKSVQLDFYLVLNRFAGRDVWATVIWNRRTPINIELVEMRVGEPEYSPPTAVVSQLFSRYYWDRALNGQ
jgi:hypothetical protein|tara:strand:+ start:666 stop:1397 length:732 start_codon:yes stop_codon:yes gene_type:complete